MSSIVDQLTALSVFVDDILLTRPAFADAEVLTLALLQGCLGVPSLLKQTYRLVDQNYRSAFPASARIGNGSLGSKLYRALRRFWWSRFKPPLLEFLTLDSVRLRLGSAGAENWLVHTFAV